MLLMIIKGDDDDDDDDDDNNNINIFFIFLYKISGLVDRRKCYHFGRHITRGGVTEI
jgi:hypothetical protein